MNEEQRKILIKETFNTISGAYDSKPLRFFTESAQHIVSSLRLRGNERVIDVATGTGNVALALSECLPQGFVTGIDFSSGMLEQARKKSAERNRKNITFIEADMQTIPMAAELFDAAVCAFGIFFVDDMDAQLSQIAGMVKPGGRITICNFEENYFLPLRDLMVNRLATYHVEMPPPTWKRIADSAGCEELFSKAGLRDIRVEQKNMGYFLSSELEWWNLIWNAGFRRTISQLKPEDLEQFKKEHMQEIAALKTKDGIWLDIGVLYTTGRK